MSRNFAAKNHFSAFTLVEILIVIMVMAIVVSIGVGAYTATFRTTALKNAAEESITMLRLAQQRAMSQEQASAWGVRVSNIQGQSPYMEIFVGTYAPGNVTYHYALPGTVSFQVPSGGSIIDITFAKLTGIPSTSTTLIFVNRNSFQSKNVTINEFGAISTD